MLLNFVMKDYTDIFLVNKIWKKVYTYKGIRNGYPYFYGGISMSDESKDIGQSVIKDEEATIYLISIIGEIEGHECLPSNSKTTKD